MRVFSVYVLERKNLVTIDKVNSYMKQYISYLYSSDSIVFRFRFVYGANFQFDEVIIDFDNNGRTDIGDINGDGFDDIIVHRKGVITRNADGALVWYKYQLGLHIRSGRMKFFIDEVMIVDRTGWRQRVVTSKKPGNYGIWWFRNPGGAATSAGPGIMWEAGDIGLKDLEVGDVDKDGKLDIVIRNRSNLQFSKYSDLMDRQNSGY